MLEIILYAVFVIITATILKLREIDKGRESEPFIRLVLSVFWPITLVVVIVPEIYSLLKFSFGK